MSIDIENLRKTIDEIKKFLGEGFIATDIWTATDAKSLIFNYAGSDMYTWGMASLTSLSGKTKRTGQSSGSYRGPKAILLINEVTRKLDEALVTAQYPGLGNYYLINLENNHLALILKANSYYQYLVVDLSETTIGLLMNVVLPKLLKVLK